MAILGAGVQGHSHLAVVGHLLPGASLAVFDRHPERATALAEAARRTEGIADAGSAPTAREAVEGADVVISAVSFGPVRQVMTNDWLTPGALVVAVDYATTCAAEVARDAGLFVVDEVGQFLANRDAGLFDGYPDPTTTLGAAILDGVGRPTSGGWSRPTSGRASPTSSWAPPWSAPLQPRGWARSCPLAAAIGPLLRVGANWRGAG